MKTLQEITQLIQSQKPYLKETYGLREVGIFGSYLRHEATPQSDVDILIEFEANKRIGLLALIGLENYLSDLLDIKVDLVLKKQLKKRIGQHILREVVIL